VLSVPQLERTAAVQEMPLTWSLRSLWAAMVALTTLFMVKPLLELLVRAHSKLCLLHSGWQWCVRAHATRGTPFAVQSKGLCRMGICIADATWVEALLPVFAVYSLVNGARADIQAMQETFQASEEQYKQSVAVLTLQQQDANELGEAREAACAEAKRQLSAEQQRYASGHATCLWSLSVLSVVRV
jgi:hypothetical protein